MEGAGVRSREKISYFFPSVILPSTLFHYPRPYERRRKKDQPWVREERERRKDRFIPFLTPYPPIEKEKTVGKVDGG